MGYEVKLYFHPRKEEGGYDTSVKEETVIKVGKPFDDTPLERLAGVVMSQMARRDVWVLADETEVTELVKSKISFKECKDGKGIVLKNKKFSFNEAAQLVAEDMGVPDTPQACQQYLPQVPQVYPHEVQNGGIVHQPAHNGVVQHPHELIAAQRQSQNIEDLYGNPNKPVPVVRQNGAHARKPINQKKVLYQVYFEPYFYEAEAKRLKLKFTPDKKYPVHEIIPDPAGRLDNQKLAVTDDVGRIVEVEEKFFTSAGMGLMADKDNRFSGSNGRGVRKPKLAFEDEMYIDAPDPKMAGRAIPQGIPLDDGSVPDEFLQMPDIRPGKRTR